MQALAAPGDNSEIAAFDPVSGRQWATSMPRNRLPVGTIKPELIRAYLDADTAYPAESFGIQCQGTNDSLTQVGAVESLNDSPGYGSLQRQNFGRTAGDRASHAIRLAVHLGDRLSPGTPPRCEVLAYPSTTTALPIDRPFWFAVQIWLDDWAETADEQIVAQWHQNDPRLSQNPFLAVVVRGNSMRFEIRHSDAEVASRISTQTVQLAFSAVAPRRWTSLVFRARLSPTGGGSDSNLTVWKDGLTLADYVGPLGYRLSPGSRAYAKAGIYKWLNGNPWDAKVPERTVMIRKFLILDEPPEGIKEPTVRAALTAQ